MIKCCPARRFPLKLIATPILHSVDLKKRICILFGISLCFYWQLTAWLSALSGQRRCMYVREMLYKISNFIALQISSTAAFKTNQVNQISNFIYGLWIWSGEGAQNLTCTLCLLQKLEPEKQTLIWRTRPMKLTSVQISSFVLLSLCDELAVVNDHLRSIRYGVDRLSRAASLKNMCA